MNLHDATDLLQSFRGESFRERVKGLESRFAGCDSIDLDELFSENRLTMALFEAAVLVKHNSSQINEIIHTIGILLALPKILKDDEKVVSMSLAAANTGKGFDLETTERLAEFTFIEWQGGSEVIRQNKIFKDFYFLAEAESSKHKELYTVGTHYPKAFFASRRAIGPILQGNAKLGNDFRRRHGDSFSTVDQYYAERGERVAILDIRGFLPQSIGLGEQDEES